MKQLLSILFCVIGMPAWAQVVQIPTVVHVLWHEAGENLPDSMIQDIIAKTNLDLRRQNADAWQTPEYFLPVAADTEIELVLATTDPEGNETNGITRTYTDSSEFWSSPQNMKFDETGGKTAWNTCKYLNVWIIPHLTIGFAPNLQLNPSQKPGGEPSTDGIVLQHLQLSTSPMFRWRTLTMTMGIYLGLEYLVSYADTCEDTDSIADTPFTSLEPFHMELQECEAILNSCGNGFNGDMYMNFMAHYIGSRCMNLFTQGQKERMHGVLNTQRQGLLNPELCATGVESSIEANPLALYPNPTSGLFRFEAKKNCSYTITDFMGKMLQQGIAVMGRNTIDLTSVPNGIYFVRMCNGDAARVVKVGN
jgi:hypothetical protein